MSKKKNKKNKKTTSATNVPEVARDKPHERKKGETRPHGEGLSKNARRARNRRLRAEAAAKAQPNSEAVVKMDGEPGFNMLAMPRTFNQSSSFSSWGNAGSHGAAPDFPFSTASTRPTTETRPFFPVSESIKLQPFGSNAVISGHGSSLWARNGAPREVDSQNLLDGPMTTGGYGNTAGSVFLGNPKPLLENSATRNTFVESSTFGQLPRGESDRLVPIFTSNKPRGLVLGLLGNNTEFGQPPKPVPGFTQPLWVRVDPVEVANCLSKPEKSLEDLYNEYPGKKLRGIEPNVLNIAAQAFQQVADEAANDWLKTACPNTRWKDKDVCVESFYDYSAPQVDNTILSRAVNLQRMKNTVTTLIRNSRAAHRNVKVMTPLTLVHVVDHCISICHVVDDSKRKVLLEKAKEKMEWLPVGLDCKKLDIHRRAARKLEQYYSRARAGFASTRENATAQKCEAEILDHASVEFQEYRLEFVVEMFRTIQQLLVATA